MLRVTQVPFRSLSVQSIMTARNLSLFTDQLNDGLVIYPVSPEFNGAIFLARTQATYRSNALSACSTDLFAFWSVTLIYAERKGTLPVFSRINRAKSLPLQLSNFLN